MGRGRQTTQQRPSSANPGTRKRYGVRVALFGGPADGRQVEVDALDDAVSVHMTRGGNLFAGAPNLRIAGGEWLGIYEFVGPRGPEKPVFVHRAGTRRV